MRQTILTGLRTTGIPHLGNYIGSIRPMLRLQEEYMLYQIVADMHAIPVIKDPKVLNDNVRHALACYLACGFDHEKSVIWRQSQMKEVGLLISIFATLTSTDELDIMVDRKNNKNMDIISYMYPILMSADVLMIDVDYVFAGVDHTHSLEFVRRMADSFNKTYGNLFKVPKIHFFEDMKELVKGLDGRKMSKSFNNTITIIEPEDKLYDQIMNPKLFKNENEKEQDESMLKLLSYFISPNEYSGIKENYLSKELNSTQIRELLFNNMNKELTPIRNKYNELINKPDYIDSILEDGLTKVKKHSSGRIQKMMQMVGF